MSSTFKIISKKSKIEKKRRKLYTYSPTKLALAIKDTKNGNSVLGAAKKFGIPRETLRDKIHNGTSKIFRVGPDPLLGFDVEEKLEQWLLEITRRGAPIPVEGLVYSVQQLCKKKTLTDKFKKYRPGRKWVQGFFRRHPVLSVKKSEYLSHQRALLTESAIRVWFENTRKQLASENVDMSVLDDPTRVFNLDETALYTNPSGHLVIAERGKTANSIGGSNKENATILFTADATGKIVTKLLLLPYERLPASIVKLIPNNWDLGKSPNGWMTAEAFYEFIANNFVPYLKETKVTLPVIVFLDGHSSHLSMPLSQFCMQNEIILICLPPNATHFIQPLDVGFYGPFKKKWQRFTKMYKLQHDGAEIKKHLLPKFINEMGLDFFELDIKKAFKVCGLFPFNENNLPYEKLVSHKKMIPDKKAVLETVTNSADHLYAIESKIDKKILEDFKFTWSLNVAWAGDIAYSALFDLWKTLKIEKEGKSAKDTATIDSLLQSNESYQFIVSNADDTGLSSLIIDDIQNKLPIISEDVITTSIPTVEQISIDPVSVVSNGKEDIVTSYESFVQQVAVGSTPEMINNPEPVLNKNIVECSEKFGSLSDASANVSNSLISEVTLPQIVSNEIPKSPVFEDISSPPVSNETSAIPEPVNSPLVEDVLASIILFPKKNQTKTQANRKQLPSVISSQKWRDLFNAKDEIKKNKEDARKAAKIAREELKKSKEEAKQIKAAEKKAKKISKIPSSSWQNELLTEQLVDDVHELPELPLPLVPVQMKNGVKSKRVLCDISNNNIESSSMANKRNNKKLAIPCLKVKIDDFIVVRYTVPEEELPKAKKNRPCSKPNRDFVGKVLDINDKYQIRFLRPYNGKDNVFIFPNIEDKDLIDPGQIVKILTPPNEYRGHFKFASNPFI